MKKLCVFVGALGLLAVVFSAPCEAQVKPAFGYALKNGDVNGDGARNLGDALQFFGFLFLRQTAPVPLAYCGGEEPAVRNGDLDGDGLLSLADGLRMLRWLYADGSEPVAACGGSGGRNANPRVIPPHAKPYGRSYGEWLAAWNQWAFSLPRAGHPVIDPTGENCDAGQSGPVWFLGFPTPGPGFTRECTVPPGKSILIPLLVGFCSTFPEDPDFGETEEELRECSERNTATIPLCFEFEAEIDGVSIQDFEDYLVTSSPLFDVGPIPEDGGLLGLTPGDTGQAIAGGVFLLLAPLSRGEHVIHLQTEFRDCAPQPALRQLTYIIHVER